MPITGPDGCADSTTSFAQPAGFNGLSPFLMRLDQLLRNAVAAGQVAYGAEAAFDSYRGLYISREEAERLLSRPPGVPVLWGGEEHAGSLPQKDPESSPVHWLWKTFDLSEFDIDVLIVALAPELDLRYERLYAFLQDDVAKRRPSVDLALNLLCPDADAKMLRRTHFAADAPLIRHGIIHLDVPNSQTHAPLLACTLRLDEQIVKLLLGHGHLDSRLALFCRMIRPFGGLAELHAGEAVISTLQALTVKARLDLHPLRLYFHGARGVGKRAAAEALAGEIGSLLLVADPGNLPPAGAEFDRVLRVLFREAWFHRAVVYLEDLDTLRDEQPPGRYRRLLQILSEDGGITILSGVRQWTPPGNPVIGVIPMAFGELDFEARRKCWETALAARGAAVEADDLNTLADRFRLTPVQIAEAALTGCSHALGRALAQAAPGSASPIHPQPILGDLLAAARAQSNGKLSAVAKKIDPKYDWSDIVLPSDQMDQLKEICNQVHHRHIVYWKWGFGRKLSLGKGVNALFSGPSGTGKTMAAEIIANELGLDLYKIDLSQAVSKYIGETEKNLNKVFSEARSCNAILFFDEADALFGKRSEVKDAHDRYANIEIGYLLQKMEEYDGVAILATNLRQNMDDAFIRRIQAIVEFPFPDEAHRRRIWQVIFPQEVPIGADVDFDFLAREAKLTGGNIKNIALASAFYAAEHGGSLQMSHFVRAARREYQKLGRVWNDAAWRSWDTLLPTAGERHV